nr:EAL domain-containing protein [Aliamphritea spongicola]
MTLAVVLLPLRAGLVFTLVALWSIPALSLTLLVGWKLWFAPAAALIIVALPWPLWNVWQLGIDARLKHKLLQQLAHQVQHHVATGLPNAVMLRQRLNQAIAEQQGAESCVGLLVIHFNWSGSASTTLECPVDDTQLKKVGSRLREVVSDEHFIAHLNGDDFAVLLTDLQEAEHVKDAALSLLQALQKPLQMDDESYLLLTPRIGASLWPDDCFDADGLIRNAYTAMFKSRVDDSDTLCVYSQGAGLQLELRSQVEQALVHALERNEFEVYYQPQVRADDGRMVGVEALLRWNSPKLGRIPPGIFIPVAEHVGLIPMIGSWVLKTACEQLQDWHDAGLPHLRLAINVSPLQFADPELERRLAQTIKNMSITPGNIELEITEGSLMWDMDQAVNIMKRMKAQGWIWRWMISVPAIHP